MSALAPAMQAYFSDRMITQRGASPNTIASYRDTFRLLLRLSVQSGLVKHYGGCVMLLGVAGWARPPCCV
jgi:hypothetical protein